MLDCFQKLLWCQHCDIVTFPQAAFQDLDAEAVYLISDGKPDTSTSLVLREVAKINLDRRLTVNTISLNNSDSSVSLHHTHTDTHD